MHHKRKRPRNRRAGCKLCKPWKVNGFRTERKDGERFSDHRRRHAAPAEFQTIKSINGHSLAGNEITPLTPIYVHDVMFG